MAGQLYGGQCLSFLSFKLHPEHGLMLTAMYRNHTYITQGASATLSDSVALQAFVAKEARSEVGFVDVHLNARRTGHRQWLGNKGSSKKLIEQARCFTG